MTTTFMTYKEENEVLRQKIAKQATVIEKLSKHSNLLVEAYNFGQFADDFNQPQARNVREALRETCEALATPTDSKQILQEWLDKVLGEEFAWVEEGIFLAYPFSKKRTNFVSPHSIQTPLFKKPEIK